METEGASFVTVRKTACTPKAIIHQKFGSNACYKIEEVHESAQNGCPGLAFVQKGPCLYRCTLQLPEITVVSGIFKKKKDAEQSAAELALEKVWFISFLLVSYLNDYPSVVAVIVTPCLGLFNKD